MNARSQLVLVWSPGKGSPIHDHGNAHCLMKILKGDLTETRYSFPDPDVEGPMQVISEKTHRENAVAYMADELGVHRVWNKGSDFVVSLHCRPLPPSALDAKLARLDDVDVALTRACLAVYTPPNVAKGGCNIFMESTGRKSHVSKCGNYSAYGKILEESTEVSKLCEASRL